MVKASAVPSSAHIATVSNCRNCGTIAPGNYCPECGQETSLHPPSVGEFIHEFMGHYVAIESTLAQTLWALISKPGKLTVDYLAGRKRRYVLPLKLYLTVSIVTFVIVGLLGHTMVDMSSKLKDMSDIEMMNGDVFNIHNDTGGMRLGYDKGKFICTGMPSLVCAHLGKRFDHDPKELRAMVADIPAHTLKYWSYAMLVLVPLFAALLYAVYRNRRLVYGEHLVFALHLHTFWLLAVLALSLMSDAVSAWIGLPVLLTIPVYALLAMRRAYGGRWLPLLLRSALLTPVYAILMLLTVVIVAFLALLF